MNKLLAVLIAGAFAFASVSATAQDKTPSPPVDQAQLKAERNEAKAKFAKMTPEEKAAMRKAANAKKRSELTEIEKMSLGDRDTAFAAKQGAKDAAASKAGPAPAKGTLNTPEANKALQQQKGQ